MRRRTLIGCCLLVATLAGCGSESKPAELTGSDEPAATHVAQQYVDAYAVKDAQKICRLVTAKVRQELGGTKCAQAVNDGYKGLKFEKLKAERSYRQGDTAIVTFVDSLRQVTVSLEKGTWKVSNGGA